jgi:hypothetical protein
MEKEYLAIALIPYTVKYPQDAQYFPYPQAHSIPDTSIYNYASKRDLK